jgi:hypothetical protein
MQQLTGAREQLLEHERFLGRNKPKPDREFELRFQLSERAEPDLKVVYEPWPGSSMALGHVRSHRNGGATHLRSQTVSFRHGEPPRELIAGFSNVHTDLPRFKVPERRDLAHQSLLVVSGTRESRIPSPESRL